MVPVVPSIILADTLTAFEGIGLVESLLLPGTGRYFLLEVWEKEDPSAGIPSLALVHPGCG